MIKIFNHVDDDQLGHISRNFEAVEFNDQDEIVVHGRIADGLFIIEHGKKRNSSFL